MHPSTHARSMPNKPAVIMARSGGTLTFRELDDRSNQVAQLFRRLELKRGDVVVLFMENLRAYFELAWGAQRSGLYFVGASSRLTADELSYILTDSGARLLVCSSKLESVAQDAAGRVNVPLLTASPDGESGTFDRKRAAESAAPIADQSPGIDMLYSSGTTGRPKGVRPPLPEGPFDAPIAMIQQATKRYGMNDQTVYLSPAPLYHSAPLRWCMTVQRLGGTVVVAEQADAEELLALIERFHVTQAQFVPTHFVRMLRLPEETRRRYDLSSLVAVFHAAAPCPIPVKRQMLDWWGPVIHEFYGGSEGNGVTCAAPDEWLAHEGTVGRAFNCEVKICGDDGEALPVGETGLVYFAGGPRFAYHNDPEKTAAAYNQHGWSTLGDVGRLDEDGFLYLTDRKSFMIISGGVNIYPQEIENVLLEHAEVFDAAVVGGPDPEFGENVIAVVQPDRWPEDREALAVRLLDYMRAKLSPIKLPKRVDFIHTLPRTPTGKLMKRLVRDAYWQQNDEIAAQIQPGLERRKEQA